MKPVSPLNLCLKAAGGVPRPSPVTRCSAVFDAGRHSEPATFAGAAGLHDVNTPLFGSFRRNHRDREARETVTAKLLGDPSPDRVVPDIPPEPSKSSVPQPAPIHLTFREMRAAYGETQ